jgi:AcrR family transcriptional regulator
VLARDGLARATTRAIAAEASINQATLLYYAGSKDALLMAVLREMMRATRALARAAIPDGVGPREAIRQCVTAFWEHVEAAPELEVMQYELTLYALRHGDAAWLAREQYAGYGAVVEDLLRDTYIAAGETCALPFDALARFIVGGLDGLILQFVSDRDTARARRDRDTLIAAVLALANGANTPDAGGLPAPPARGAGGEVFRLPSPRGRGVGGEVRPREETRP